LRGNPAGTVAGPTIQITDRRQCHRERTHRQDAPWPERARPVWL